MKAKHRGLLFKIVYFLAGLVIFSSNYLGKEGPFLTSYLAVLVSPVATGLVMLASPESEFSKFIWRDGRYQIWFLGLVVASGYFTWLSLCKILGILYARSIECLMRMYNNKK